MKMLRPTTIRRCGRTVFRAAVAAFLVSLGALAGLSPGLSRANAWINEPVWIIGINDTTDGGVHAIASHDSDLGWWNAGAKETWGTGYIHATGYSGPWFTGSNTHCVDEAGGSSFDTTYDTPVLKIVVHRSMSAQHEFLESYTFTNTGKADFNMTGDALGIYTPLNDSYISDVSKCEANNVDVHLWAGGGSSSWVDAVRMNGAGPRLGLVLTEGSLSSYSQTGEGSEGRGLFVLHPGPAKLAPGESYTVGWKLFQHQNWDDFFSTALKVPGFVRMEARNYTVVQGQPLEITATSGDSLDGAQLLINDVPINSTISGSSLSASPLMKELGEQKVELVRKDGRRSFLAAWVSPDPDKLIYNRVAFIVRHQQKHAPGDPLDGAYLTYDNETGEQIYVDDPPQNHNGAGERIAMGILPALYLAHNPSTDLAPEIKTSLQAYLAFILREHQDEVTGQVYNAAGRKGERLYDYSWFIHFHLALYQALGDKVHLQHFVQTCRAFYAHKGATFYPIGMPILEGLQALQKEGMTAEYKEILADFTTHADNLAANGLNYSNEEVYFEQSIVAPSIQFLLETYLVTHDVKYLMAAKQQMPVLEAFLGHQPDHHLNDVAIRYWDDFWFGKSAAYGDTFPHYWSTITAMTFDSYARATGDQSYASRAQGILRNNWSLFTADGKGSCAFVYPQSVNGKPGYFNDPWANDQDWALVNYLVLKYRVTR